MAGSRTPSPTGLAATAEVIDEGTLTRNRTPPPGTLGIEDTRCPSGIALDESTRMLAATAYGESSGQNVFEEMAAIANVLVRQQKARKYPSFVNFIRTDKNFAFATQDGNPRYAKVRAGIRISQPSHNIYGIASHDVPGETWWRDDQGHKTRLRGRWNYKFESTAAWGGTIFWRYNPDFLHATGNKEYD